MWTGACVWYLTSLQFRMEKEAQLRHNIIHLFLFLKKKKRIRYTCEDEWTTHKKCLSSYLKGPPRTTKSRLFQWRRLTAQEHTFLSCFSRRLFLLKHFLLLTDSCVQRCYAVNRTLTPHRDVYLSASQPLFQRVLFKTKDKPAGIFHRKWRPRCL